MISLFAAASPAQGATTIGHVLGSGTPGPLFCSGTCTLRNAPLAPEDGLAAGGNTAPAAGVVTRFGFYVAADAQEGDIIVRPRILRGQAGIASASPVTLVDVQGAQTFPTRLPIAAGDGIGVDILTVDADVGFGRTTAGSSVVELFFPALVDGGPAQAPFQTVGGVLDMNAEIEPDADGDGFGDETQDLCPRQAATQGTCEPPQTFINQKKLVGKDKDTFKVKFAASVQGAEFKCQLDKTKPKTCTSPVKYKNLDQGKHKVAITAIESGLADPTPAVAKVKVKSSD